MKHIMTSEWEEPLWRQAEPIYERTFPEHGRKPEAVLRRMFDRGLCRLHLAVDDAGDAAAMALTGFDAPAGAVILDYLAVDPDRQGQGVGSWLLQAIAAWAKPNPACKGILVEAEAEPTEDNRRRIRFWERNGFRLTDYVHHYIWVPEPYRAMALSFREDDPFPEDGQALFRSITRFHRKAYRG